MAIDPTQKARDIIQKGVSSIIPSRSPLGSTMAEDAAKKEEQTAIDEANNLVELRDPVALPESVDPATGQPLSIALNPILTPKTPVDPSQIVTRNPIDRAPADVQGTTSLSPQRDLEGMINSGISQQQAASKDAITQTDSAMLDFEKSVSEKKKAEDTALSEVRKKIDETDAAIKSFKWDNSSVWSRSSTPQKVALTISGFLSSLSTEGAKAFQESVARTLNNDLLAQKEQYNSMKEGGKSLSDYYGQLVQKFGNEKSADLAMMNSKLGMISNKLKILSETANSKLVAANALKGLELTDSTIMKNKAELAKTAIEHQSNRIPGYANSIPDKTQRAKFISTLAKADTIKASLADLEKVTDEFGVSIGGTKASDRSKLLTQDVQLQLKEIKELGVLSGDDARRLDDYISDNSLLKSSARMKSQIAGVKDIVNKAIRAQEFRLGLKKEGANIGRIK